MTTNVPIVFHWTAPIAHALGFLTFGLALLTIAGVKLPILVDERTAFYALAAAGFLACTLGMAKISMEQGWMNPITLAGMILGTLAMLLVAAMYFGRHGLGRRAAHRIFDMFPGMWSVSQEAGNLPAQAFWCRAMSDYTDGEYEEASLEHPEMGIVRTFRARKSK